MKELTIREKAIAYDKSITIAKNIYRFSSDPAEIKRIEQIFPEFKESKDEEIRKEIIEQINLLKSATLSDLKVNQFNSWINWLEKRGEQKPADKVEPRFHEGEWITRNTANFIFKIINVGSNGYEVVNIENYKKTISFDNEHNYHLWTIKDAKDGDVLVNQNGEMPFIFKECKNNHIYCYCGYTNRKDIFFNRFVDSEGEELHWLNLYHEQAYPATKEQRDLLFSKMKKAGYKWDAEKKELKKIEQKPVCSEEQHEKESLSDIENSILNFAMQFHDNRMKPESEWIDEAKMLRDIIPSIYKTS